MKKLIAIFILLVGLATSVATAEAQTDSTPPSVVTNLAAVAAGQGVSASWNVSVDAESGIQYYMFGIGTVSTGDYSTLANTRWWQVTYSGSFNVTLTLVPGTTYYVSVIAVNGAGLWSAPVTSPLTAPPVKPLGDPSNVMRLAFSPSGLDATGAPTAGFTAAQTAEMTTFFNKMYPILVDLYGVPAFDYTVTVVRDLRYQGSNIFFPSTDEIHMSDGFYPQLFTHEVLHAFRRTRIISSNSQWGYEATLSGFEEGFAQAVSYEAMNQYVTLYGGDGIVAANTLWGSDADWNYDYQNDPVVRTRDFWSDGGGTGIYWLRYSLAAAVFRKINIESPGFYKAFNVEYYKRLNADPALRSSRSLVVSIIAQLVPMIEGTPASAWLDKQNILYAQDVLGDKIYNRAQDYPAGSFYMVFDTIYYLNTMSCGSEWACWNGSEWVYYNYNGAAGTGTVTGPGGQVVWSGPLVIEPGTNPAQGTYVIGSATKNLTTASSPDPWPGGDPSKFVLNLTAFGLYRFDVTFGSTTKTIYRMMGSTLAGYNEVYGAVVGHQTGTLYFDHESYPADAGILVSNGVFQGPTAWTGVPNARTGGTDSTPGKVSIRFVDTNGTTYTTQRNIDYGSSSGNQMFYLDFGSPTVPPTTTTTSTTTTTTTTLAPTTTVAPTTTSTTTRPTTTTTVADTVKPVVSLTSPTNGSNVNRGSTITIRATATDNRGVSKVEFYVNGVLRCTDTSAAYTCSWSVPSPRNVRYTLRAKAYDAAGNTAEKSITVTAR